MDRLQEGKSEDLCEAILKYAEYFIAEFLHFLRMHGFIKPKHSTPPAAPNPPLSTQEQKMI